MLARRWPRSFHNTLWRVGMPIVVARCSASSWRRTSSPLGVIVKYEPTSAADCGYASKTIGLEAGALQRQGEGRPGDAAADDERGGHAMLLLPKADN